MKTKRFRKFNIGCSCKVDLETSIAYGLIVSIGRNNYSADIFFPKYKEMYTINRKDVLKIGKQLSEKSFKDSFTIVALTKGFNQPPKRFNLSR